MLSRRKNNYDTLESIMLSLVDSACLLIDDPKVSTVAKLECVARTFCGVAPWLQSNWTSKKTEKIKRFVICGISYFRSSDIYKVEDQLLVETAYMCLGFIRCGSMWRELSYADREIFLKLVAGTRKCMLRTNNWIMFPAMIETFLQEKEACGNAQILTLVLELLESWYKGDGLYGDGKDLQMDYYNSYVIHPMLTEIIDVWHPCIDFGKHIYRERAVRYATIQENMISPEGTFPVMGRSSCYRFGAFAHLSDMLRRDYIEKNDIDICAAQEGLTAVILKMFMSFDFEGGRLRVGLLGKQTAPQEYYISEGSQYICCMAFAHLALSKSHPIWKKASRGWTQKRIWLNDSNVTLSESIHV